MNLKTLFILTFSICMVIFSLPKQIQKKVDKEIMNVFSLSKFEFKAKIIDSNISKNLPSEFNSDNFFEIIQDNSLFGYAYISKAPSKTDSFDYLIILDKNLTIKRAKVLVYREDYGSEIGSKRWLQQFIGKTQNDQLKYKDDVVALSGATISARSMTNAINNLLKSIKILHSKQII